MLFGPLYRNPRAAANTFAMRSAFWRWTFPRKKTVPNDDRCRLSTSSRILPSRLGVPTTVTASSSCARSLIVSVAVEDTRPAATSTNTVCGARPIERTSTTHVPEGRSDRIKAPRFTGTSSSNAAIVARPLITDFPFSCTTRPTRRPVPRATEESTRRKSSRETPAGGTRTCPRIARWPEPETRSLSGASAGTAHNRYEPSVSTAAAARCHTVRSAPSSSAIARHSTVTVAAAGARLPSERRTRPASMPLCVGTLSSPQRNE